MKGLNRLLMILKSEAIKLLAIVTTISLQFFLWKFNRGLKYLPIKSLIAGRKLGLATNYLGMV